MSGYNSTRYRIDNYEAIDAQHLYHTPNYSLDGLVELGPSDQEFMGAAKNLPNELKAIILIEKFLPGPRVIRAVYNIHKRAYTYRCISPPNKIPYVIYGLDKLMAPLARTIFKEAPWLGINAYPFFNPTLDTISLEYLSCATSPEGSKNYMHAVQSAAEMLEYHAKDPAYKSSPVRKIQITWCHNEPITGTVLNFFRDVPNLEKVTLVAHDHYTGAFSRRPVMEEYNFLREHEDEPADMRALVRAGELKGSVCGMDDKGKGGKYLPYPFEVELVDHNGDQVLFWEDDDAYFEAN